MRHISKRRNKRKIKKSEKSDAEKLLKKQHKIFDKYGYVEGRKILAKKKLMKQSILLKLRRRALSY